MKITITWTSQRLPEIMWGDFDILNEVKSSEIARMSIQNTSAWNIYIENGKDATTTWSYKLSSWQEIEFYIWDLTRISLITDGWSLDVRIITT